MLTSKQGGDYQRNEVRTHFTNSCESYAWFDQNTSSWRTWQAILNNGMGIVLGELCKARHDAEWSTFRASDYVRACHHRDRWWLHCNKQRLYQHRQQWIIPQRESKGSATKMMSQKLTDLQAKMVVTLVLTTHNLMKVKQSGTDCKFIRIIKCRKWVDIQVSAAIPLQRVKNLNIEQSRQISSERDEHQFKLTTFFRFNPSMQEGSGSRWEIQTTNK